MTYRIKELLGAVRDDRADADPVLTVASVLLSALISASIVGMIVVVLNWGGNWASEQTTALSLTQARKLWSQDASSATLVTFKGPNDVFFYDAPGKHPGIHFDKAAGANTDKYCRKSEWLLTGSVLTNTVSQFAPGDPLCDLNDPSVKPTSSVKALTISGLSADAHITAVNSAGRDLHFTSDGAEVGLSPSAAPTDKSVASRNSYWRDYEWDYQQPSKVDLVATVDLPISGKASSADLIGDTYLTPTPAGETANSPEPVPAPAKYSPGTLAFSVSRSSTVGAVEGGVHEGIEVSIVQAANCGPYSVAYTLTWTPSTSGAPSRSTTLETFVPPAPVDFDQVPNGASGTMQVTASCPPSVQSGANTVVSQGFTQSLPAPVLSVQADATSPNIHTLNWSPVSSLSSVVYRTQVQVGNAGWVDQQQALPNPASTAGLTISWQLGSTYGQQLQYHVTPEIGSTVGTVSNDAGILTPWPPVVGVSWALYSSQPLSLTTTINAYPDCPAGTSAQYSQRYTDGQGTRTPQPWSGTTTMTTGVPEGQRLIVDGQVRCDYNAAQHSPAAELPTFTWVEPITTKPNAPLVTAMDSAASATGSWNASGCPAGTSARYEWRARVTTNGSASGWSPWTTWNAATSAPIAMSQGALLDVNAVARCQSPYTYDVAPAGTEPTTQTNGPASPVGSLTGWVRPIQPPAGVASIWHDAGGTSAPVDNRFLWSAVACPTDTWAQYSRALNGAWYGDWVASTAQNAATAWGTTYTPVVQARCMSDYGQSVDGPPVTGPQWTTNVPTPTGVWNNASPSTLYTGDSLRVSVGGANCPAGTSTVYWTTDGAGDVYNGSFPDRWGSAGTHTYKTYAYCQGPNARGGDSAPAVASVNVLTPPAPGWSGVSTTAFFSSCMAGTTNFDAFWSPVPNADSYSATASWEQGGFWSSASASPTYNGASGQWQVQVTFSGDARTVQAGSYTVTASGPGGSSTLTIPGSWSGC